MPVRSAAQRADVPPKFPPHYLEQLIESSPDIVVAIDRDGAIVFYNDGAERNLGFTSAEILGQNVTKLYPSIEEARRVMNAMRSDHYGGPGKIKNFETIFADRWGRYIPVAISGSILYDDAGLEIGSIGFAKDIRDIRQRDRMATLGEVAVAVCHEVNNPLAAIFNQLSLLRAELAASGDATSTDRLARVDGVRRDADRIQAIVTRLAGMAEGSESYATREYHEGQMMADLKPAAAEPAPAAKPEPAPAPVVPASETPLDGLRVLVVDDDDAVRDSLRDLLEASGCLVSPVGSGLDALRRFQSEPFDLIVSDVVMPDLDGYDLFMEVKRRSGTPMILMTGYYYDRDHVIKRSRLEGLEGVLFKKPVDPDRLLGLIRQVCHATAPAASTLAKTA